MLKINFITHNHYYNVIASCASHISNPFVQIQKRLSIYFLRRSILRAFIYQLLVISYTIIATAQSLIYPGMRLRNLSCPAVSQICNFTVLSS